MEYLENDFCVDVEKKTCFVGTHQNFLTEAIPMDSHRIVQ